MNVQELIDLLVSLNANLPITILHGYGTDKPEIHAVKLVQTAKFKDDQGATKICLVVVDEKTRLQDPVPSVEGVTSE